MAKWPLAVGFVSSILGCFAGIAAGALYGPAKMLEMGIVNKYSNKFYKGGVIVISSITGSLVGGCIGVLYGPVVVSMLGGEENKKPKDPEMIDRI